MIDDTTFGGAMGRLGPYKLDTIVSGDCLDVMRQMPDGCVDAVVADPPYGINHAEWDKCVNPLWFAEILRVSAGTVLLFSGPQVRSMRAFMEHEPDRCLIWSPSFTLTHGRANGCFYRWHAIWLWRLPDKLDGIKWDILTDPCLGRKHEYYHPAMKPEQLIQRLVASIPGDVIFDPFMGSGTTAVAAKKLGRHYFGCDISEEYVKLARERVAKIDGVQLELPRVVVTL